MSLSVLNVVHLDMDAFYASVEQRDDPSLKGRPVVVGGTPGGRGVVCAASYEARRFGVRSAMPVDEAYRRCPEAAFVPSRMAHYQDVSRRIMAILRETTTRVEPLSLDEAYCQMEGDARDRALGIKERIREDLGLTASVGVSYNKFLAKLASDMDKPDGFVVIDPDEARRLLPCLSVRRLWGIGPHTERSLRMLGIKTVGDLLDYPESLLERKLGARARDLLALARGEDERPVESEMAPKSLGEETTFPADVWETHLLARQLEQFALDLKARLRRRDLRFRTVTVKVKYSDFSSASRSQTFAHPLQPSADLMGPVQELLKSLVREDTGIRLIGLTLSNLEGPSGTQQLSLPTLEIR